MLINPWHISEMGQHALSYLFIYFFSTLWVHMLATAKLHKRKSMNIARLSGISLSKKIHIASAPHNHCSNDIRKKFAHIRGREHIHHFHCRCLWMREHNPGLCTITDKPPWNADMSTIHTHLHDNQRPEPSIVIHHPDISPHFTEI